MQRAVLPFAALWLSLVATAALAEETPHYGPVIPSFGPVMPPPEGSFALDTEAHYKVSMDMDSTPEFPGDLNRHLVSAARFLNMNVRAGVPRENIEFALIAHGQAVKDLLSNKAYKARYNDANPNADLLSELNAAGVKIYLCSQTVAFRGFSPDEFHPAVSMAVSAMSSHVRLQQEGYTLIPF